MQTAVTFIELRSEKGKILKISSSVWKSILKNAYEHGWQKPGTKPPLSWDEPAQGKWSGDYETPREQIVTAQDAHWMLDKLCKVENEIERPTDFTPTKIEGMSREDAVAFLENLLDLLEDGQFTINPEKVR
ncbi:MAG: hypothetical protein HY587_04570 [Candidatus Omnitrophica bacterium]|nr:hypothetical protein [Candidatus Omnitrophota bacterium]